MRKTVLSIFVALAAVLAVPPSASASAGADKTDTVACCGKPPIHP
ncbi:MULTISPECIES: hypothetical protein [Streptomyces]|nr:MULTISPECIES: hypothetical protein [Streptomyces]